MKNKKPYYIFGGVLCLLVAIFVIVALTHPEFSFPWPNWVSYTMYTLYVIYTAIVFLMPSFKDASLAACGIVSIQFVALSFIALSIGSHFTTGETNWYLPTGLGLTCVANFTNLALQKKRGKTK